MSQLFIDIETIATSSPEVRQYVGKHIRPPGNIKKPESIDKWWKEEAPALIDESVQKTALDGAFGQVVCFGFATVKTEPECFASLDEPSLLFRIAKVLNTTYSEWGLTTQIVGHNVHWDCRFLYQRFIVNKIDPPEVLRRAIKSKPWDQMVFDTMIEWAGTKDRVSLDKLCMALGVKSPKNGIDGSMVGEYIKAGKINEVAVYCADDVRAVKEIYERLK